MDLALYGVACAALCIGAIAQRTVGIGFGLIVTPAIVLAYGPLEAVMVVNVYGTVSCLVIVRRVWNDVNWRKFWLIGIPAAVCMVPGVFISLVLDTQILTLIVGVLAITGVLLSVGLTSGSKAITSPHLYSGLGGVAGLLNGSVAIGAPALGALGILTRWEHREYAATLQPFWVLLSGSTVLVRLIVEPGASPTWPWWAWAIAVVPLIGGVMLGDRLAHRVNQRLARTLVIWFSLLGGVTVLISAVVALLS